jgi:hypothetical protein
MSAMKPARNVSVRFLPREESAAARPRHDPTPRPAPKRIGPSLMSKAVLGLVLVSMVASLFV